MTSKTNHNGISKAKEYLTQKDCTQEEQMATVRHKHKKTKQVTY